MLELSSWKHDDDDIGKAAAEPTEGIRIVKRTGYVVFDDFSINKGGGSAEGGDWMPSKADDGRFLGEPGDIINSNARGGYERDTVIGENGRGVVERHYTDHDRSDAHSPIHDHIIDWEHGYPGWGKPINYFDGEVPYLGYVLDLFKSKFGLFTDIDIAIAKESSTMRYVRREYTFDPEEYRFKTISDFKWCVLQGGEVEFVWNNRTFGVFPKLKRTPDSDEQILVCEKHIANQEQADLWCNTADEALEYLIDGARLREIITQVEVTDRTI